LALGVLKSVNYETFALEIPGEDPLKPVVVLAGVNPA
jgi:hypothetical protein